MNRNLKKLLLFHINQMPNFVVFLISRFTISKSLLFFICLKVTNYGNYF